MAEEKKRKSFTRKNEFLKDSRDILTEMNDNINRYNQGLKEATNFTQKMTENNAKIVESAIALNQEGALTGKQTKAVADLSKQIVEGSIDEVKSKRMQNDLEKKLKVAQDKKFDKGDPITSQQLKYILRNPNFPAGTSKKVKDEHITKVNDALNQAITQNLISKSLSDRVLRLIKRKRYDQAINIAFPPETPFSEEPVIPV